MKVEEFNQSLSNPLPPSDFSEELKALWFESKNNWEEAHNITQEINSLNGAWIHAYLHRKEGDIGNAGYWYARAGKKMPSISLEQELQDLIMFFIKKQ